MTDNLLLWLFWCSAVFTVFLGLALLERWAERRAQKRRDKYLLLTRLVAGASGAQKPGDREPQWLTYSVARRNQ